MKPSIHIGIVDDNSFQLNSTKQKLSLFDDVLLSFAVYSASEAISFLAQNSQTDLVLMDIEMPEMDGIEATRIIKSRFPQIKILMLTVFDNDEHIFNAILAGADGYLLKDTPFQELHQFVLNTIEGGAAMTPSIAMKTLKLLRNPIFQLSNTLEDETSNFSKREVEVLEQLAKGLSYTFIAENLFVAPATVRKHIENIYKKLQVHSKIEAIDAARKRRII